MSDNEMAEVMIDKFLGHANIWAESSDKDSYQPMTKENYVLSFDVASLQVPHMDERIVTAHVLVDDWLHSFTVVGIFDNNELIHLTSEVDTEWHTVGYVDWRHIPGISPKNERFWHYENLPKD